MGMDRFSMSTMVSEGPILWRWSSISWTTLLMHWHFWSITRKHTISASQYVQNW